MLVCWLNAQGFPSAMVAGGAEDLRDGATLAELCDVVIRGADPSSFQLRPSDDRSPASRFQRVLGELRAHRRDIRIPASLAGKDAAKPWDDDEVRRPSRAPPGRPAAPPPHGSSPGARGSGAAPRRRRVGLRARKRAPAAADPRARACRSSGCWSVFALCMARGLAPRPCCRRVLARANRFGKRGCPRPAKRCVRTSRMQPRRHHPRRRGVRAGRRRCPCRRGVCRVPNNQQRRWHRRQPRQRTHQRRCCRSRRAYPTPPFRPRVPPAMRIWCGWLWTRRQRKRLGRPSLPPWPRRGSLRPLAPRIHAGRGGTRAPSRKNTTARWTCLASEQAYV